jgi:hypothetical protein
MPTVTLESLPAELLAPICECLDREHTPSLLAFASASKYCYAATTALLFRTIKFSVVSRPQLAKDVKECYDMLQRAASFSHVRRLVVDGQPPRNDDHERYPQYQWHRPKMSAEERGYDHGIFARFHDHDFIPDNTPAEAVYETNDGWRPLADLIMQLPSLSDFIYGCPSQFPPCLLQILHQHRPQCRLHVSTFKLLSLNAPVMDAHEVMLATSPCLYSVKVQCEDPYSDTHHGFDSQGIQTFHYKATMRLVAGLSPSLKEVTMYHSSSDWNFDLQDDIQRPWQPLKDSMLGNKSHRFSPGSLRCLKHWGHGSIGRQIVENWRAHINFSVLCILNLESPIVEDALAYLATNCDFPCLKTLVLTLETLSTNYSHTSTSANNYFSVAKRFLRNLPRLSNLKLLGDLHRISLGSFLDHQGPGLRELWLGPFGGYSSLLQRDIAHIGMHCLLLEHLVLALHRSRGNAAEVAAYRTLGSLPKLQDLSLRLDASDPAVLAEHPEDDDSDLDDDEIPPTPSDPSFDEFDHQFFPWTLHNYRKARNGHIRDAFINSAVDETLVRDIFWTISAAKPDGSLPLERMKVSVFGGGYLGSDRPVESLRVVIGNLSRSWLVERNPRDDCREELIIKELGKKEEIPAAMERLHPDLETIFRRIWPAKQKKGGNWWEDWHSWPLSASDT